MTLAHRPVLSSVILLDSVVQGHRLKIVTTRDLLEPVIMQQKTKQPERARPAWRKPEVVLISQTVRSGNFSTPTEGTTFFNIPRAPATTPAS